MTMSENIMQKKLSHVKDFLCNMGMLESWGKTKNNSCRSHCFQYNVYLTTLQRMFFSTR